MPDHQSLALLSLHDPYRLEHARFEEPDSMDEAYRQHANPSRRKNCSSNNLSHLSLAPLTSRLPLSDDGGDPCQDAQYPTAASSYLQGKSAPTTPGLLGKSPAHHARTPLHPSAATAASLPKKSLSATALNIMGGHKKSRHGGSGTVTPTRHHHHRLAMTATEPQPSTVTDRDWLEHTGALLSDSAREYKGQAWMVSRDSSTSLTGHGGVEEHRWNMDPSRSRRSSISHSRAGSRAVSRVVTPQERHSGDDYFTSENCDREASQEDGPNLNHEWAAGPDFVNPEDDIELAGLLGGASLEEDEAAIQNLVRGGNSGVGGWFGGLLGWPLFSVEEGDEVLDEGEENGYVDETDISRSGSTVRFQELEIAEVRLADENIPPPNKQQEGTWQDAAWLLSVASRVLV